MVINVIIEHQERQCIEMHTIPDIESNADSSILNAHPSNLIDNSSNDISSSKNNQTQNRIDDASSQNIDDDTSCNLFSSWKLPGYNTESRITNNDIETASEINKRRELEAKALREYGDYLSRQKNDHDAAIVTLMSVLKKQAANDGSINADGASTLQNMGNAFVRRSRSSKGDKAVKDAKRAEFCYDQAADLYLANENTLSAAKITKSRNVSKRLQLHKRRRVSFNVPPPPIVAMSSSCSISTCYSSDDNKIRIDESGTLNIICMDKLSPLPPQSSSNKNVSSMDCSSFFCHDPSLTDIMDIDDVIKGLAI